MITKLSLTNFRNHRALCLETRALQILLSGSNGSGKTSVLEAISVLMPGRGIRNAHMIDILYQQDQQHLKKKINNDKTFFNIHTIYDDQVKGLISAWQIGVTLSDDDNNEECDKIKCTYYLHRNQKEISFNGKAHYTPTHLTDKIAIISLVPQMDFIFLDAASERRKLLDRIIYNFIKQHANDVHDYEQQLRARLKLLKNGYIDNKWLDSIEFNLAVIAVRITMRRLLVVEMLNGIMHIVPKSFCHTKVSIDGKVENICRNLLTALEAFINQVDEKNPDILQYTTIESINKLLQNQSFAECYNKTIEEIWKNFTLSRNRDAITKQSNYGAQKADLVLYNIEKNIPAKKSSTGEQKSMIIALILAQTFLILKQKNKKITILLLDDILQHLDLQKRNTLLETLRTLPIQTWITGTNLNYCHEILDNYANFNLDFLI